jgi:nicotinamidase-related amidase
MSKRLYIGIDLQDGFLTDEIRSTSYVLDVTAFLAKLDKAEVILTRFVNQPYSPFVKFLDWPDMQPGAEMNKLFGDLENAGYEVIEKPNYSAWPIVGERLKAAGVEEVVLFGLDSDACVLKTALDVFEAGLRPIVLADLCQSSAGNEWNEKGLALLGKLTGAGQVMQSADILPLHPES